ncbi:MAG: hypothetical protein K2X81_24035 [Candidatus Obscuribacterales bacterium]|nr:hypothetical protein [Candidatus Obscuribacterales bacterium]
MVQSGWLRLSAELRKIRFVFTNLFDVKSARNAGATKDRQLQWSLPFIWFSFVFLSYCFGWQTVYMNVPAAAAAHLSPLPGYYTDFPVFRMPGLNDDNGYSSVMVALAADPLPPVHGADPHGRDPHREQHDGDLPANSDQDEIYGEKDPRGNPK